MLIPRIGAKVEEERKLTAGLDGEIGKELNEMPRLSELAAFEDSEELDREILTSARLESIGEHAQVIYLIATELSGEAEREAWQRLDAEARDTDAAVRAGIADQVGRTAIFIEGGQPSDASGIGSALTAMEGKIEQIPESDRARFLRRVIKEVQQITSMIEAGHS